MNPIPLLLAAALASPSAPPDLPPVNVQGESIAAREQQTVADLLARAGH